MTQTIWQAFYYDSDSSAQAPARSELIEAESETAALAIARQHIGQAKRIELSKPRWESGPTRVIHADEERRG